MGDGTNHVMTAVQEQQTVEDKSEMCFCRKIDAKLLLTDEETKQQVMVIPQQQQTTESEDKSELSIGHIGVKLPTTTVPGISLMITLKSNIIM